MHSCKRNSIFVEQFKTQNTMINTTDFLNALRIFEYVAKQKDLPTSLKIQVKKQLLNELSKVEEAIRDVDLGDYPEIFEGTNEALKNL